MKAKRGMPQRVIKQTVQDIAIIKRMKKLGYDAIYDMGGDFWWKSNGFEGDGGAAIGPVDESGMLPIASTTRVIVAFYNDDASYSGMKAFVEFGDILSGRVEVRRFKDGWRQS